MRHIFLEKMIMIKKIIVRLVHSLLEMKGTVCGKRSHRRLRLYAAKIPMSGQVESLNAAIAASVLMFEVRRQQKRVNYLNIKIIFIVFTEKV